MFCYYGVYRILVYSFIHNLSSMQHSFFFELKVIFEIIFHISLYLLI